MPISSEDFISLLSAKFRAKDDDERNRAFVDDLFYFTSKCPEQHLEDVFRWVSINHKYSTPFQLYKIYDYAEEQGYISKQKQQDHKVSWFTCVSCGTHYSTRGRMCPRCREKKATVWKSDVYPESFVDVKEDCAYCTIYPEIKKNPKWMTFKDCGDYGVKQTPECRPCQCRECCKQMMLYNADPRQAIEKYHTGELAQPWLYSVDPLNKTVELMVKDIDKRKNPEPIKYEVFSPKEYK